MRHSFYTLPLTLVTAMAAVSSVAYAEDFIVRDMQIEGLVRLTPASVYGLLPITSGELVSEAKIAEAIRALYNSNNFDDVQAKRSGDVLIFSVIERPVIASIKFEGNKLLPKDSLETGFKTLGLTEGQVLQRAVLQNIENDLEQQYAQQGRYDADVQIETVPRPNNRVDLNFKFIEGTPSRVVDINIIGNTVFSDKDIQEAFAVKASSWSSIITRNDRYARERLSASLESLRSMYLNKGYINFELNSAQITLSEDKKKVFVEISVNEGQQYRFAETKFLGDPLFDTAELMPLSVFKAGDIYSQAQVNASRELLSRKYGNAGYYFAEINPIPEIDEATKTVQMTYFINPGRQIYVRRVNFLGNTKTADEVMRRELRQMEGALASNEKINLSKIRLERTGYFKSVSVEAARIPNSPDQMDVNITVEEQASGTSTVAVGYSASGGVTFTLGLSQTNFLGTGNQVNIDLSRSETLDNYNIGLVDPYFTIDGVSRGYNAYYRKTKLDDSLNINNYVTDSLGGGISFGYPVDENRNVSIGLNIDQTALTTGSFVAKEIRDFILANDGKELIAPVQNDAGDLINAGRYRGEYLTYNLNLSWLHNTLNRPVFATRGQQHRVSLDIALPGSDLEYQRLTYDGQVLFPLGEKFALRTYTRLGYGNDLPFHKNYFAGGYGSVRGYRNNTLGPRSEIVGFEDFDFQDQEPIGGNALIQGGMEVILPLPFRGDWTRQIRPVIFVEGGQVFNTTKNDFEINSESFRMSAGVGFTWITVIGPLSLSYAYPINDQAGDERKSVQFEIGRLF
ncbi:MAG: outer membrane protein assembly factor BamA [Pseudomonadota bacterium]|nr:outer membrane protein assembly factor BamA [Pseudomonadota bacterium]